MHCSIIQLSDKPIQKKDYINANDFIDWWFVGEVANYVEDDSKRENTIKDIKATDCGIKNRQRRKWLLFNDNF